MRVARSLGWLLSPEVVIHMRQVSHAYFIRQLGFQLNVNTVLHDNRLSYGKESSCLMK